MVWYSVTADLFIFQHGNMFTEKLNAVVVQYGDVVVCTVSPQLEGLEFAFLPFTHVGFLPQPKDMHLG